MAHGGERRAGATAADEGGSRNKSLKAIKAGILSRIWGGGPKSQEEPIEASAKTLNLGEPGWAGKAMRLLTRPPPFGTNVAICAF